MLWKEEGFHLKNNRLTVSARFHDAGRTRRARGLTLVEVMVAMALLSGICAGLYRVGWQARRYAEYARLANEARGLAKEKLEELVSHDLTELRASPSWWNADSNSSHTGASVVRQAHVVWHDPPYGIGASYAEIHVDVAFRSPLWNAIMTNTFSTLVQ